MRKLLYTVGRRALYALRRYREYLRPIGPVLFQGLRAEDVQVAKVGEEDVELLDRCLPSKHASKHQDRLRSQERGTIEYLIARYGIPVGYVVVVWDLAAVESLKELGGLPEGTGYMEDLYVHPAAQGKGIGGLLWKTGEERLRAKGYKAVLTTVMLSNPEMERTHLRRGYRPFDSKVHDYRTRYTDEKGRERVWRARVKYFIRDL